MRPVLVGVEYEELKSGRSQCTVESEREIGETVSVGRASDCIALASGRRRGERESRIDTLAFWRGEVGDLCRIARRRRRRGSGRGALMSGFGNGRGGRSGAGFGDVDRGGGFLNRKSVEVEHGVRPFHEVRNIP